MLLNKEQFVTTSGILPYKHDMNQQFPSQYHESYVGNGSNNVVIRGGLPYNIAH